jgi:limonene-1,2-epoxide hydrolase
MDRRTMMAGLLAGPAGTAQAMAQADSRPAQLAEQFAATLSRHDIDAFAALFSEAYLNHQTSAAAPPPAATITPKQGTVAFFAGRLKGLADLNVSMEAMVAGEDKVAASFVYTGTH